MEINYLAHIATEQQPVRTNNKQKNKKKSYKKKRTKKQTYPPGQPRTHVGRVSAAKSVRWITIPSAKKIKSPHLSKETTGGWTFAMRMCEKYPPPYPLNLNKRRFWRTGDPVTENRRIWPTYLRDVQPRMSRRSLKKKKKKKKKKKR
jgi:hypothetical protein